MRPEPRLVLRARVSIHGIAVRPVARGGRPRVVHAAHGRAVPPGDGRVAPLDAGGEHRGRHLSGLGGQVALLHVRARERPRVDGRSRTGRHEGFAPADSSGRAHCCLGSCGCSRCFGRCCARCGRASRASVANDQTRAGRRAAVLAVGGLLSRPPRALQRLAHVLGNDKRASRQHGPRGHDSDPKGEGALEAVGPAIVEEDHHLRRPEGRKGHERDSVLGDGLPRGRVDAADVEAVVRELAHAARVGLDADRGTPCDLVGMDPGQLNAVLGVLGHLLARVVEEPHGEVVALEGNGRPLHWHIVVVVVVVVISELVGDVVLLVAILAPCLSECRCRAVPCAGCARRAARRRGALSAGARRVCGLAVGCWLCRGSGRGGLTRGRRRSSLLSRLGRLGPRGRPLS
mmetsp:Transcript_11667/g.45406  ORF Transcript_11667/g.45406 Transcript_11667/m.45406 type:complete len:402 (+) Transcript_11667:515-1720(+)